MSCIFQICYPVICESVSHNAPSNDSNSTTLNSRKPSIDLGTANSDEEDVSFLKNCSERKTISKRDTTKLSQVDDDKDDSSNNGASDMGPKRNSSKNLHNSLLTFPEKEEGISNESEDNTSTTGI